MRFSWGFLLENDNLNILRSAIYLLHSKLFLKHKACIEGGKHADVT